MDTILHQIFLAVATLAAGALTAALTNIARAHGLAIDSKQEDALREATRQAIDYAEEKAASYVARKLTSHEKLQAATSYLRTVTGVSSDEADRLIHSELPSSNAGAATPYDPTQSVPKP